MPSDSHSLQHGDTITIVERSFRFESIVASKFATPIQPARQTPVPGSRLANHTSADDAAKSSPSVHSPTRTPVREHSDYQQHHELPVLLSISRSTAASTIAEVTPPGAIQKGPPPSLTSNSPEPTKSPTRSPSKAAKTPEKTKSASPAPRSPLKVLAFGTFDANKSPLSVANEVPPDWIVDEQPALSPMKATANPSRFVVTPTKTNSSIVDDAAVSRISPRLNSQPVQALLGTPQRVINSPVMQRTPETSMIVDSEISASPTLSPKIVRIESPLSQQTVVDDIDVTVGESVKCNLSGENEEQLIEKEKPAADREPRKDELALTQESVHFEVRVSGDVKLELSSQAISGSFLQSDTNPLVMVTDASQIESISTTCDDPPASCTQGPAALLVQDFDHHPQQGATTGMMEEQGLDNPFYVEENTATAPSALTEDQAPRSSPRRPTTLHVASSTFTATPTKQAESVDAEMASAKKTPQPYASPHKHTSSGMKSISAPQAALHSSIAFGMSIATPIKQIDGNIRFTPEIYKAAPPTTPSTMHDSSLKAVPSTEPVAKVSAMEVFAPADAGIPEAFDSSMNVQTLSMQSGTSSNAMDISTPPKRTQSPQTATLSTSVVKDASLQQTVLNNATSISTPSKQQLIEQMVQSPQNPSAPTQQTPMFHVASPNTAVRPSTPLAQTASHPATLTTPTNVNTPDLSVTPSKTADTLAPSKLENNTQLATISSPTRTTPARSVVLDKPADASTLLKEVSTLTSSLNINTPAHTTPAVKPATPSASIHKSPGVDDAKSTPKPISMPASAKKTPASSATLSLRSKLSRSASKNSDFSMPKPVNSVQPEYSAQPAPQITENRSRPEDSDVDMAPAETLDVNQAKLGVADDGFLSEAKPAEKAACGSEDRPGSVSEHNLQTSENISTAVHFEATTDSLSEALAKNNKALMQAGEKAATEEAVDKQRREATPKILTKESVTCGEQASPLAVDAPEIVNAASVQPSLVEEPSFVSTPRHSARVRQSAIALPAIASASAAKTSKTPKQEPEPLQVATTGKRSTRARSEITGERISRAKKDPEESAHEKDEPRTAVRQSSRKAGESKSVTKSQKAANDAEEPKTATRRTGRTQKQGPSKTPVAKKARATSKSAVKSTSASKKVASTRKAVPATEPARKRGKRAVDDGEETGMEESPTLNAAARRRSGKQSKENVQQDNAESFIVGKKRAAAHAPDEIANIPAKRRQLRSGAK